MPGNVKAIPEGFHTLTPSIVVREAARAIDFYKTAFGAELLNASADGPEGKITHASLKIGDSILMLNDEFPEWHCLGPLSLGGSPVTIHIYVENVDEAFDRAVEAGATVTMPLQNQFWGDRYGQLVDPFGHKWSIGAHVEDVTREEIARRAEAAFNQMTKKAAQGA
jgi:PhnB protein